MHDLIAHDPSAMADQLDEMEFRELAKFGDGAAGVFWSEAGGPSPWEMHPDCDEMLHILNGEVEIEVLPADGSQGIKTRVQRGSFFVVPRGCWHRQYLVERTKEFYLTPGRTLHSQSPDPRTDV
jgi:mannose-6-phosphate isomerase-like protein (cupin superfamily)